MIHSSRVFAGYLVLFLLSVAYFSLNNFSQVSVALLIGVGVLTLVLWRVKVLRYILLAIFVVVLAAFQVQNFIPNNTNWINKESGKTITAKVLVLDVPKVSGKSQQILAKPVKPDLKGNISIVTASFPEYQFGDFLEVRGKLTDAKTQAPQLSGYFRSQNIQSSVAFPKIGSAKSESLGVVWDSCLAIRKKLLSVRLSYEKMISRLLPEPQAGLLSGILLGSRADLPSDLLSFLTITSTVHIIALSGYNITIVAAAAHFLCRKLSRRLSFWLPVIFILFFVLATGLASSAVRAAIMGVVLLLASQFGRQSDAPISVLFASAAMVFVNPNILLFDIGFQLSFVAVCGILFLAPRIENVFSFLGKNLGPVMAQTVAAQLFTLPVLSYYFGRVSIIAPIANILILPLIPPLMAVGFAIATLGFVSFWLAKILAIVIWLALSYIVEMTRALAGLKLASVEYKMSSPLIMIGFYLLLFDLLIFVKGKKRAKATA